MRIINDVSQPSRMLRNMDSDGSNCLTYDQFARGIKNMGNFSDNDVTELFKGSGTVNIDEFLLAIRVRE